MAKNSSVGKWAAVLIAAQCWIGAQATTLDGVFNSGESERETEEGGTLDVKFHPCPYDQALSCGTVVAFHDDGDPDAEQMMPDGSPLVGFTMITDLENRGDGKFRDGKINAVDESIEKDKMVWYGVKVDALEDGRLKLRGCLGFVCPRTMYWTAVAAPAGDTAAGE